MLGLCVAAFTEPILSISRHTAPQSLRLPQDIIFVLLLPVYQFVVPSYRLSSYGRRAFCVAGPMTWNSLPRHLRDTINTTFAFGRLLGLKQFSFQRTDYAAQQRLL